MLQYAPDLPQETPEVLVDVANVVPTQSGVAAAPALAQVTLPALADECRGGTLARRVDDARRLIAGTDSALYEATSSAWNDVSRGGGYTLGADGRWRFTQYGNATLAIAKTAPLQASISGDFDDASASAPSASCILTVGDFIMVADTDDATYGDSPDRWWCSALGDYTSWTPSIATQAATNRLTDTPGRIFALRELNSDVVAYKARSIYVGRYIGPPFIWDWKLISSEVGAWSQESVVTTDQAHYFLSDDGPYMLDGTRVVPIGVLPDGKAVIKQWLLADWNPAYRYKTIGRHDRAKSLIYWHYVSKDSSGTIDRWVAYNYRTGGWGRGDMSIEAALDYASPELVIDDLDDYGATIDTLTEVPFDSPFWIAATVSPAVVDTTHRIAVQSAIPSAATITTGDVGDEFEYSLIRRVHPRWVRPPAAATLTHLHRADLSDALIVGASVPMSSRKRFDLLKSNRWHRATLAMMGNWELSQLRPVFDEAGDE